MTGSATTFPHRELPPDPGVLLKSLRGIGYSVEDAVADIVDNSLSAGALNVEVRLRDVRHDVLVDIVDDGAGLSIEELLIALTLGARERDPSLSRRDLDLGRFGLGLKTASFSVAQRLAVFGTKDGIATGAAWDLEAVAKTGKWLLSGLTDLEQKEFANLLAGKKSGTVVRWSRTDRLGVPTTGPRTAAMAILEDRLRRHLGMVYHRFIDGFDPDGVAIAHVSLVLNGRPVGAWNPLVPFTDCPELVQLGEVRIAHGIRVEYAVLPPDSQLLAQARQQATIEGRRLTDMQGFYVYRGNRLVCFASWLNLPGAGGGRWNRESSTQLARIAVDLTNASDEEWALDVRKSRVSPPDLVRPVLVEVGTEARALSRARIFGRGRSQGGEPRADEPVPSLWSLGHGRLEINRSHPLVAAIVTAGETSLPALRSAIRSLLRQLEASPALVALISEPNASPGVDSLQPAVFDDADFGEAMDLGRCLITSGTPMRTVIEIVCEDPRYRNDSALLERLRTRLEQV